jgi:2-methylcitrate dehydratase PrpD
VLGDKALQPHDAAFVNSVLVHALLQDDVDLAIGHPACCVVPAALAAAAMTNARGDVIVAGVVAGYEAMWRVGGRGAFMIPTIARGFRGNTLLGAFGSAAATARILGLDAKATTSALGAAASFAAGLLKPLNAGAMERPFQQAGNTQHGMIAAFLAADGLDGCASVLEGEGGLYRAFMGSDAFPHDAFDSLGSEFHITETFCKPYPSAGSNTVGLAVLEHLLLTHGLRGDDVVEMKVEVVPRFTGKPGYPAIANPGPFASIEHALISFPFELATLARCGHVDLATLTRGLGDGSVLALAAKIDLVGAEVPYPLWCRITVDDARGRRVVATADEIEWRHFFLDRRTASEKYLAAATPMLGAQAANAVVACVLDLDRGRSGAELDALLRARITPVTQSTAPASRFSREAPSS